MTRTLSTRIIVVFNEGNPRPQGIPLMTKQYSQGLKAGQSRGRATAQFEAQEQFCQGCWANQL